MARGMGSDPPPVGYRRCTGVCSYANHGAFPPVRNEQGGYDEYRTPRDCRQFCIDFAMGQCGRWNCRHPHGPTHAKSYVDPLPWSSMPSDDKPERSSRRHQLKIVVHTAGAKHGGPPQDPGGCVMGHSIYVGNHGKMPLHDYGRPKVARFHTEATQGFKQRCSVQA